MAITPETESSCGGGRADRDFRFVISLNGFYASATTMMTMRTILDTDAKAGPRCATVAGNELKLFAEWSQLLESMVGDIQKAERRIWLEVYIFADDTFGQAIAEALTVKARAGVEVRLHYDALGCSSTPQSMFDAMAAAGVQLHEYHSFGEGLRRFRPLTLLNRRNHRKILIVDDRVGYFGGMNVTDTLEAPPAPHPRRADEPPPMGWRDAHVRLEGPKVGELAASFHRSWLIARHENRLGRVSRSVRMEYRKNIREMRRGKEGDEAIYFFDSGPSLNYGAAGRVYTRLMQFSRGRMNIGMAYFIPMGRMLRNLFRATRRGVRVRVVVPGRSDVPLVQRATAYLYDRLLKHGVRIYEREERMLHTKVMTVDERFTAVGSANMDPRALFFNLEFVAVIRSETFARLMNEVLMEERRNSRLITRAKVRRVSWWQRVLNFGAWNLRWWL